MKKVWGVHVAHIRDGGTCSTHKREMPVIRFAWAASIQSVDGFNVEGIGWRVMAYFCEHCNEPSGYVRSGESHGHFNNPFSISGYF